MDELASWLAGASPVLSGLGSLATVVAAIVAVFTLARAGRDSAVRTRPYVVVELDAETYLYKRGYLIVRNTGASAARNVAVHFEPSLSTDAEHHWLAALVAERYSDPIPVIGPGQVLRSPVSIDLDDESRSDLGPLTTVSVRYGPRPLRRAYKDTFQLKRSVLETQVHYETSDSKRGSLKQIAAAVKELPTQNRELIAQIHTLQESIVKAVDGVAVPARGVRWRVRRTDENWYLLENTGTSNAYEVRIEATSDVRNLTFHGSEITELRPREHVRFHASGRGHTPQVEITWLDGPDEGAPRRSCTTRLPR